MRNEDKRERFERLAERRTAEIIKKIRLIGNLANRGNYSYSGEHIRQMFGALEKELKTAREKFSLLDCSRDAFAFKVKGD